MKNILFKLLGFFFLGLAFIGAFLPIMPTTSFAILAVWAFAKSSPKLEKWVREHPVLGKYIEGWEKKRVYPTHGKWAMTGFMTMSLIFMVFTVGGLPVLYAGIFFLLIIIWAWRYPGSEKEYDRRVENGERIGWLK